MKAKIGFTHKIDATFFQQVGFPTEIKQRNFLFRNYHTHTKGLLSHPLVWVCRFYLIVQFNEESSQLFSVKFSEILR